MSLLFADVVALLVRIVHSQADGPVDLVLECLVRCCETDGSKDGIHLFQRQSFRLRNLVEGQIQLA